MVGPVAVGADPDLEQDGLALDHGQVAGGGEGLDPAAGPHERERERELDLAVVARPLAVHEALPERGDLRLPHPRAEQLADVVHRRRRELVRQPQALELLLGLDRACPDEERRRVRSLRERVEPRGGEGRGLADHAVRGLRAERELEPDPLVVARGLDGGVERPRERRPRILGVVAADQPHVLRPGRARGVLLRRLDRDQHRLALAREDAGVVALHPPEVREVEDVVGRADDERVELCLRHELADAVELGVVARPGHGAILRRLAPWSRVAAAHRSGATASRTPRRECWPGAGRPSGSSRRATTGSRRRVPTGGRTRCPSGESGSTGRSSSAAAATPRSRGTSLRTPRSSSISRAATRR